ncbi:MAG: endonuclease VIII [Candidatus Poseidoniales archaeon]|nr:MAG: endonuclease VIII [Candidatus Poseidoniales archaeon]
MPEGPEIRRAADRIGKALVGKVVLDGQWPFPSLNQADELILGHEVLSVTSRAKAMLIRFSSGWTMYSHNQLYGRWTVHLKTTDHNSRRSLRAEFMTDKHAVRLWSATDIQLVPTAEENGIPFLQRLGPDVLDPAITSIKLQAHLREKKIYRKKGATLMLDQRCFAGLGNYLRSEILHAAGIHPDDRPCDLDDESLGRWATAIKEITQRAYLEKGVTVPTEVALSSKARGEPRRMWRHAVFCRNDRPCLTCGDLVLRKRYAGRRLDYCPSCQPARRDRS